MKIHHLALFFISIFFCCFYIYGFMSQKAVSYSTTDKEYSLMLTSACNASLEALNSEDFKDKNVFTYKNRITALNTFYRVLAHNMNLDGASDEQLIKNYVPLLIFVDTNGFYMIYSPEFNSSKEIILLEDFNEPMVLSSVYTWSRSYDGYIVRFYLNDYIEIIAPDGMKFDGCREELSKMEIAKKLTFLLSEDEFESEKRDCILSKIENEINLCLNTQKINVDGYFTGYTVNLPFHEHDDYADMIKNPSIITLMQGNQTIVSDKMYNIYSFVIAEMEMTMY